MIAIVLIFHSLFQNIQNPDSLYLHTVTNDFHDHSYFVAVNIISNNKQRKAVVENLKLMLSLESNGYIKREEDYRKMIINFLKYNKAIKISSALNDLRRYKFVRGNKKIEEVSKKGLDKFIKTYFKNGVLKSNVSDEDKPLIISKLFEWRVFVKTEDESGLLYLPQAVPKRN